MVESTDRLFKASLIESLKDGLFKSVVFNWISVSVTPQKS